MATVTTTSYRDSLRAYHVDCLKARCQGCSSDSDELSQLQALPLGELRDAQAAVPVALTHPSQLEHLHATIPTERITMSV